MNSRIRMNKSLVLMCRTALLCAVALVLSVLESMIPTINLSFPGMKLGLSNIAVMFALEVCPLPCALSVVAVKALFSLVSRGVAAFMMSFCGGMCATLLMFLLVRSKKLTFGYLGIGVLGAFMHNMGQLAVAYVLVADAVVVYLPFLCAASIVTGALTGLVCFFVLPSVKRIPLMQG